MQKNIIPETMHYGASIISGTDTMSTKRKNRSITPSREQKFRQTIPEMITCFQNNSDISGYTLSTITRTRVVAGKKIKRIHTLDLIEEASQEIRRRETNILNDTEFKNIMRGENQRCGETACELLKSSYQYAMSLEDDIRLKQNEITKMKNNRIALRKTSSNGEVDTEQVDESTTDSELFHSNMSQTSSVEDPTTNDLSNPLHLYENDDTSRTSPESPFEEISPYISASKFSSMDYRVIFKTSCEPQIIASAAGNIIACNDSYLNLTNQIHDGACKRTIFSIVKPGALFELYKYVGMVLKRTEREVEGEISTLSDDKDFVSIPFECAENFNRQNTSSMKLKPILEELVVQYFHCIFDGHLQ